MNLTLLVVLSVTGSGKLVTQERPVEPFHALSVSSGVRAQVHHGSATKVIVRADDNVIESIETTVKDGRLVVRPRGALNCNRCTMELDVTVPALDAVEASGGTEVKGDGLSGSKCRLELSGGTHVELGANACEQLDLNASGGAVVKLSGQAKQLKLDASGGVELDTRALDVKQAQLEASGGVSGQVAVSDTLEGKLSGGVALKVKGHPRVGRLDRSGSARTTFED